MEPAASGPAALGEDMSEEGFILTEKKRRYYSLAGMVLLGLGLVATCLNIFTPVQPYQKVSWLMTCFFLLAGAGALGAARRILPQTGRVLEYGEALVVAIVLAIAIRGCLVQAFKIPSGSMLPTLLIGDHLLVNKFMYGIRVPYTGARFLRLRAPKRGDVVVFAYPVDDSKDFIKRVIGEPGDQVQITDKVVYVNGKPLGDPWAAHVDSVILPEEVERRDNMGPVVVPAGQYFVMGDNRDKSYDSRFWGFVEDARIRGKAFVLYWSWDSETFRPRLRRIGSLIR